MGIDVKLTDAEVRTVLRDAFKEFGETDGVRFMREQFQRRGNLTEQGESANRYAVTKDKGTANIPAQENPKAEAGFTTIYRGEYSGNRNGNYYSPEVEFARQFTQSGLDNEITQSHIKKKDIYRPDKEVYAGDPDAIDIAVEKARNSGFKAVELSEGNNQPNSIYVFDKTALKSSKKYNPNIPAKDNHKAEGGIEADIYETPINIVTAPENIVLNRATAIKNTLESIKSRGGYLKIGDGQYVVSARSLNKMTAEHGEGGVIKPYQKERIAAIQVLPELVTEAKDILRSDDGRDIQVNKIHELYVPFEYRGKIYSTRILAKEYKEEAKQNDKHLKDKIHSLMLDDISISEYTGTSAPGVFNGELQYSGIAPIRARSDISTASSTARSIKLRFLVPKVKSESPNQSRSPEGGEQDVNFQRREKQAADEAQSGRLCLPR